MIEDRSVRSRFRGRPGKNSPHAEPLTSIDEFWYAPDLEVNLSVTRKDPREGTLAIHVVDLSRFEPDASLFQVPVNFLAEDQRRSAKSAN